MHRQLKQLGATPIVDRGDGDDDDNIDEDFENWQEKVMAALASLGLHENLHNESSTADELEGYTTTTHEQH